MTDADKIRLEYFEAREAVVTAAVRFVVCEGEWSHDVLKEAVEELRRTQERLAGIMKNGS